MTKIRPAQLEDIPAIARVHTDTWRSSYGGMVPDAYLDSLSYTAREEGLRRALAAADPEQIFLVAELAGQVVGFARGGSSRQPELELEYELYAIYLLERCQGQGIGRLLFEGFVAELKALGRRSFCLWVLEQNSACQFYEHLGGRRIASKTLRIGGADLWCLAYGWERLPP